MGFLASWNALWRWKEDADWNLSRLRDRVTTLETLRVQQLNYLTDRLTALEKHLKLDYFPERNERQPAEYRRRGGPAGR